MCGQYGVDIWKELDAIRKLLEGFQERLIALDEANIANKELACKRGGSFEVEKPKPKKKAGRPKGSKNANTKTKRKREEK